MSEQDAVDRWRPTAEGLRRKLKGGLGTKRDRQFVDLFEALEASQQEVERLERNRINLCALLTSWNNAMKSEKWEGLLEQTEKLLQANRGPQPPFLEEGTQDEQ